MPSTDRLRAFARLALATTAGTYLLILVGALVRAAGAGLGCPDWPRCFGMWIPPLNASQLPPGFDPAAFNPALTWMEYLNRLLGVTIGLLILGTLFAAMRWHRDRPGILWPTVAATALVIFQGWLGGQVVRSGLEPWMVTAHLVIALVIVKLLLYATFRAYRPEFAAAVPVGRRRLAWITSGVTLLLLGQIGLGTQVRAGIGEALLVEPELPRSEWLAQVVDLDHAHRASAQLVLLAVIALALWIRRSFREDSTLQRTTGAVVLLLLAQMGVGWVLGTMNVPAVAQDFHLSAASLLLGGLVLIALQAQQPRSA
jgi:cytochrome c oxidase assembly protein subunit 15